ncbi:MAG: NADH-quinone oxidoreductase subunit C [Gammaproteobacteria bacterium]|nr:NADH-quinone oxidoreductase subunit C [Gammaproteobacteria bacterium]
MRELYQRLQSLFVLGELTEQRANLFFITVEKDRLRPLITHLRDREGLRHLVLLTAVDWLEEGQFQLTYLLCDRLTRRDLGLRVMLDRANPVMESIHDLWPTAATYQRELREMFGIDFPGSPRLDEEFILEGWNTTPPYRRDFDTLEYARSQYAERAGRETRDPETHMRAQLYPESN